MHLSLKLTRTHRIYWLAGSKASGSWKWSDGTAIPGNGAGGTEYWAGTTQPDGDGDCMYALGGGSVLGTETESETGFAWYDADCSGHGGVGICIKNS